MVMFGLASIVVGVVFWVLGRFKLGRLVYYFPTHVLIGCVGGIGVYIAKTGIEVTIAETFSFTSLIENLHLLWVILLFEVILRLLEQVTRDKNGRAMYPLLPPIFFCMITPIFYLGLALLGMPISDAGEFFFPSLDDNDDMITDPDQNSGIRRQSIWKSDDLWDMWTAIDFRSISWTSIFACLPTLFALTLFSLIHVPINIPAFALSTKSEADMNAELIAHGYSNILSGFFCGLQNCKFHWERWCLKTRKRHGRHLLLCLNCLH